MSEWPEEMQGKPEPSPFGYDENGWPTYKGWRVVLLPSAVYEDAKRAGYDMNFYRKTEPIKREEIP